MSYRLCESNWGSLGKTFWEAETTVVIVGFYEWLDGASRTEYGGLVWQQTPS